MNYNISYSIAATIIGIALVTILFVSYSSKNLLSKRFKVFLCSTITMYVMNILTVFTNEVANKMPEWVSYLLNGLYFASSNSVAFLFLVYVITLVYQSDKDNPIVKKLFNANQYLLGLNCVLLFMNSFTGIFFNFDGGTYNHGPAYLWVNVITLLFVVESLLFFVIKRKGYSLKQLICAMVFYAVFFATYVIQVYFLPDILLSDFGVAVGSLVVFFSIETPDYAKLMETLTELNELKGSLEIQVRNRTKELDNEKQSYEELTLETLSSLAKVIDAKDHYTNGHSFRVAAYATALAKQLDLSFIECERIYFAGLIHDVGKIGISENILTKPGKLDPKEYEIIKSHSMLGGDILKGIKQFKIFEEVARSHHERFDGTGYPDKFKGDEIPFPARIVAVCDAFDAMTSDRSYRQALPDKVAIKELVNNKGSQFDPIMVDAFLKLCGSFPDSIRNHIEELMQKEKQ